MKTKILCILGILVLTLGCLQDANKEVNVIICWDGTQVLNESHCLPEPVATDTVTPATVTTASSTTTSSPPYNLSACNNREDGKYCEGMLLIKCINGSQVSNVSCKKLTSMDGSITVEGHCLRNACHAVEYL